MSKKKTTGGYKKEVYNLYKNEYSVIGEYISTNAYIKMRHNICGYEWNIRPNYFINAKNKCPRCQGKIKNKTTEDFKLDVLNTIGDDYVVLGEYKNNKTPIKMKHLICKKEYKSRPDNILNKSTKCPYCFGSNKLTTNEFKEIVKKLSRDEYNVLGEYKNTHSKIEMYHKKCENNFKMRPNDFQQGQRCPICATKRGKSNIEKEIKDRLLQLNLDIKQEKKFNDCLNHKGNNFSFDFFINNKILLEYDGEYHYYPIISDQQLKTQKQSDKEKNQYCKENKIPLLRIPF